MDSDSDSEPYFDPFPDNRCYICEKFFFQRQTLYRHVRQVHFHEPRAEKSNIICPETTCRESFFYRDQLRDHIMNVHKVTLQVEEYFFTTYEEFELWRQKIENELSCSYTKRKCPHSASYIEKIYFLCHRSGNDMSVTHTNRKRKMKSIGSKKINGTCPSSMEVIVHYEGVHVEFFKTHFGHSCDVQHLSVSEQEKLELSEKIQRGIPFQQILEEVKNSANSTEVKRIHFLTRKDLHNIAHQYRNSHNEKLHKKDAADMDACFQRVESICNELHTGNSSLNEKWCVIKQIINAKLSDEAGMKAKETDYLTETFDDIINFFTQSANEANLETTSITNL